MAQPTHTKVAALDGLGEQTKAFLKIIADVARREGMSEADVFGRWLTMSACALANPALKDTDRWDANEARYMDEIGRWRHKAESCDDMARALGVVVEALEASPTDFLGPIFSELSANAGLGQFFTPWHVSEAIARMTLTGDQFQVDERGFLLCQEPACGAGGMVLAANKVFRERGARLHRDVHWVCVDVDWRAVCACYIQLTLTGCSATVVHGNVLTATEWCVMPTVIARLFPKRIRAADPPVPQTIPADIQDHFAPEVGMGAVPEIKRADARTWPGTQMDLFGDQR